MNNRPSLVVAVLSSIAYTHTGVAQEVSLNEVVVTAQKRSESVQDVPISVQVISGDAISNAGFRNLQDLASSTPTLRAQKGPSGDIIAIRGVQSATGPSFEQAVGVFIDGIYYGRSRGARAGFLDLDRAEILKGPQSIYFGNNAIAGAYNIVTKSPGSTFAADVTVNYEPVAQERGIEFGAGGPLTDTMGLRIAGSSSKINGWMKNPYAGPGPKTEDKAYRLTYTWDATEALNVNLKLGGYDINGNNTQQLELFDCPTRAPFPATPAVPPASGGARVCPTMLRDYPNLDNTLNWVSVNNPLTNAQDGRNAVLNLDYTLPGGYTFTSVTGWWEFDYREQFDQDYGPLYWAHTRNAEKSSQRSQELRIASPQDQRLSFLAGGYYHQHQHEVLLKNLIYRPSLTGAGNTASNNAGIPASGYPVQLIASDFEEESASVFAAATFKFTDSWRATLGVRHIRVKKNTLRQNSMGYALDNSGAEVLPLANPSLANQETLANAVVSLGSPQNFTRKLYSTQRDTLPSLNVQWDITPDKMLYITASKGFQAGGFDESSRNIPQANDANLTFAAETVVAGELGLKARWLNGRLTTNVDVFYGQYSDLQRSAAFVAPSGAVSNRISAVGTLRSSGLEVETQWLVSDRFELDLNATRLITKYGADVISACSQTAVQQLGLTPATCSANLGGLPTVGAADYSGELKAIYTLPIGDNYQLVSQGTVYFTGDYDLDNSYDPRGHQDAYQRYGVRLGFGPTQENWEVAVIARNITNEKVKMTCGPVAGGTGSYGCLLDRNHSFMLQGNYKF